jgi:phage gpG-like protein
VFVSNAFAGPTTGVTKAHDIPMPARPYLPMDTDGNLQAEASAAIYDDVDFFYRKLFD